MPMVLWIVVVTAALVQCCCVRAGWTQALGGGDRTPVRALALLDLQPADASSGHLRDRAEQINAVLHAYTDSLSLEDQGVRFMPRSVWHELIPPGQLGESPEELWRNGATLQVDAVIAGRVSPTSIVFWSIEVDAEPPGGGVDPVAVECRTTDTEDLQRVCRRLLGIALRSDSAHVAASVEGLRDWKGVRVQAVPDRGGQQRTLFPSMDGQFEMISECGSDWTLVPSSRRYSFQPPRVVLRRACGDVHATFVATEVPRDPVPWFCTLMPGLPQMLRDRPVRGIVLAAAFIVSAQAAVQSMAFGVPAAQSRVGASRAAYGHVGVGGDHDYYFGDWLASANKLDSERRWRGVWIGAAVGAYVLHLVDAVILGEADEGGSGRTAHISLDCTADGVPVVTTGLSLP